MNRDCRYLITGGSGLLGRALVEHLYSRGFKNLVLMGRNENRLAEVRESYPGIGTVSGCVSDPYALARAAAGCDGIFHLAAYKNLVMAEREPSACAQSNILGVSNLLRLAADLRPDFLVFVSSSAAADVKGVYGASKFIGEKMVEEFAASNPATLCRTVRFANLWRGAGSFILNWERAVAEGRPIRITDPSATRFFISMEAAANQITAALIRGERLVVQKTKAVSIGTIADAFQQIHNLPASKFEYVGISPGEVLHQTVDGVNFSDKAVQYTVEEFKKEFLCPIKS